MVARTHAPATDLYLLAPSFRLVAQYFRIRSDTALRWAPVIGVRRLRCASPFCARTLPAPVSTRPPPPRPLPVARLLRTGDCRVRSSDEEPAARRSGNAL